MVLKKSRASNRGMWLVVFTPDVVLTRLQPAIEIANIEKIMEPKSGGRRNIGFSLSFMNPESGFELYFEHLTKLSRRRNLSRFIGPGAPGVRGYNCYLSYIASKCQILVIQKRVARTGGELISAPSKAHFRRLPPSKSTRVETPGISRRDASNTFVPRNTPSIRASPKAAHPHRTLTTNQIVPCTQINSVDSDAVYQATINTKS